MKYAILTFFLLLLLAVPIMAQPSPSGVAVTDPVNRTTASRVFAAGELRVISEAHQLFDDTYETAGTLDTTNRWNSPVSSGGGVACNVTTPAGSLTCGTGTTISGFSYIQSQSKFNQVAPGFLVMMNAINLESPIVPSTYRFWGFGTVPGTPTSLAPLTDAIGFEVYLDGKMYAVAYSLGVRNIIQDMSSSTGNKSQPTDTAVHKYFLYYRGDLAYWALDTRDNVVATMATGAPGPVNNTLPATMIAVAGVSAPGSSAVLSSNALFVGDTAGNGVVMADGTFGFRRASVNLAGGLGTALTGTLQSAAVANANGTVLNTNGMSTVLLTVNCATCGGGTTVNFEGTQDGTNYVSILATQAGTTTTATSTTTSGVTVWSLPTSGFTNVRARISAYSSGTITVTGNASVAKSGGGGGSGTISSGTTNVLAKYTAATTLGNSSVTDNGTTVSTAETINTTATSGLQINGVAAFTTGSPTYYVCAKANGGTCTYAGDGGTVAATIADSNNCTTKATPCRTFAGALTRLGNSNLGPGSIPIIQLANSAGTGTDCYQPNAVTFTNSTIGGNPIGFFDVAMAGVTGNSYPNNYLYVVGDTTTPGNVIVTGASTCAGTTSNVNRGLVFDNMTARIDGIKFQYFGAAGANGTTDSGAVECLRGTCYFNNDTFLDDDKGSLGYGWYGAHLHYGPNTNVTDGQVTDVLFGSTADCNTPTGALTGTWTVNNTLNALLLANEMSHIGLDNATITIAGSGAAKFVYAIAGATVNYNDTFGAGGTNITFNNPNITQSNAAQGSQIWDGCGATGVTCTFTQNVLQRALARNGSHIQYSGTAGANATNPDTIDGSSSVSTGTFPYDNNAVGNLQATQVDLATNSIGFGSSFGQLRGSLGRVVDGVIGVGLNNTPANHDGWITSTGTSACFLQADQTNATTTFANMNNCSFAVKSGRRYPFRGTFFISDSTAADGVKLDFNGGGAAATNFRVHCILDDTTATIVSSAQPTALATAITVAALTGAARWQCDGTFEPSSSSTFIPRFAQNAHTTGTATMSRGSFMELLDAGP